MALTAQTAIKWTEHRLGGPIHPDIGGLAVINHAGLILDGLQTWRYQTRAATRLPYRAPIDVASASWDSSTKVLTSTGSFSGYTFVPGDFVRFTSTGEFKVVSTDGANTVTLESGPATGNYAVHLDTARVALPSDFGRAISLVDTNSLTHYLYASSPAEIAELDATDVVALGFSSWYSVTFEGPGEVVPTAVLTVYPEPGGDEWDRLTLTYARSWQTLTDTDAVIPLPVWLEPLFLRICRAIAADYDGSGDLDLEVEKIKQGATFAAARKRDQQMQVQSGEPAHRAIAPIQDPITIADRLVRSSDGTFPIT